MTKISNQYSLTNVLTADTTNGRVGINNGSPTVALDVTGAGKFSTTVTAQTGFKLPANGNGTSPTLAYNNSLGFGVSGTGIFFGNLYNSDLSTAMQLRVTNSGGTDITAMTITPDGNVGIGISSPFNVVANRTSVSINGTSTSILSFGSGGVGKSYIYNDGTNLETSSSGALIYTIAGSERMRITSGGNILMGTTSDNGYKLNVSGNIFASSNIYAQGGIGSQGGIYIDYGYAYGMNSNTQNAANAWNFYVSSSFSNNIRFFYGGTGVGTGTAKAQIDTSGNYSALSDFNKKKDIALSTLGLAEVMQLKPSTFKFKDDENQIEQIGFIAQEVKDIIPQAYYEDPEGDDKFIGLKQTAFIPVLVKAIQEQQNQINELKALINA